MKFLATVLLCLGLLPTVLANGKQQSLLIKPGLPGWRFSNGREFPGASGKIQYDNGSIRLSANFTKGGNYVAVYHSVYFLGLDKLCFQLKGNIKRIAVRFTDNSKQTHHHSIPVKGNSDSWTEVIVPVKGSKRHHWGGAKDGILHPPVKRLDIVIPRSGLNGKSGEFEIKDVTLYRSVIPPRAPKAPQASQASRERPWRYQPKGWPQQQFEAFYLRPDKPGTIPVAIPKSWRNKTVHYTLKNYTGKIIKKESVTCKDDLKLELTLPAGWYELAFAEMPKVTSGILVFPEVRKPFDPFFGVDAVIYSSTRGKPKLRRRAISLLPFLGITNARERFLWRNVNKRQGEFDYSTFQDLELADMYHAAGVKVLVTSHTTPAYLKKTGYPYPTDYPASVEAWTHILRTFKGKWDAIEAWNEPDINFGDYLPADRYAPIPKMLAVAKQRANSNITLVGGVLASAKYAYTMQMTANKIPEICNAMSFHFYESPFAFPDKIKIYQKLLPSNTPIWITEAGKFIRISAKDSGRPFTLNQENLIAFQTVTNGVQSKAFGVKRYYPFIFLYWESGKKTQKAGLMRRDLTPGRGMAAYAQLINAVASKKYTGKMRLTNPKVMAQCFDDKLAIVFTNKPKEQPAVKLPFTPAKILGIDGRNIPVTGRRVTVSDGLIYVYSPRRITTARPRKPSRARPIAVKAPPLLLAPEFPTEVVSRLSVAGWMIDNPGNELPVMVNIANLGSKTLTGKLTAAFKGTGIVRKVPFSLAAGKQQKLSLKFSPNELRRLPSSTTLLFSAPNALSAACAMRVNKGLKEMLQLFWMKKLLPIRKVKLWEKNQKNGSWNISSNFYSVKMKFSFDGKKNNWAVPTFHIPSNLKFSGAAGLIIRARVSRDKKSTTQLSLLDPYRYVKEGPIGNSGVFYTVFVSLNEFHPPSWQGAKHMPPEGKKLKSQTIKTLYFGVTRVNKAEAELEITDMYVVWVKR